MSEHSRNSCLQDERSGLRALPVDDVGYNIRLWVNENIIQMKIRMRQDGRLKVFGNIGGGAYVRRNWNILLNKIQHLAGNFWPIIVSKIVHAGSSISLYPLLLILP